MIFDYCVVFLQNNVNNFTTSSTTVQALNNNAPSFRAISLTCFTCALHFRTALQHVTRDLLLISALHIHARSRTIPFQTHHANVSPSLPQSVPRTKWHTLTTYYSRSLHDVRQYGTVPHERCPKSKLLHVLIHFFPDTPSSVQLLLLSTLVQSNMSSHTTPAHIPPNIHWHMQPGIHKSYPHPNDTSL